MNDNEWNDWESMVAQMKATHGTVEAWVVDNNRQFRVQVLNNPETYLWAFESMDDLLAYAQAPVDESLSSEGQA